MQSLPLLSAASLLAAAVLCAQTPAPAAPQTRPDPNSPSNIGRTQLTNYLDDIAAKETAARRATIATITTRAQAEARQREVRKKILTLIGGLPEKTPLNAKVLGSTQADGFRIEKILYESQPNFPVTALLYLPDAKAGTPQKLPAIVVSPGHGFTGKASDYTFASTFARNGFAVLSYDPIGQGERLQYPDPADPSKTLLKAATGEHGEAGLQPTLIGDAPSRIVVWDSIRAVDYLTSRPEIDSSRIGAFGCSGGGTMTALLGALDPRVHAIAVACYLTSFDTLLPALGPQDAEQSIPNFIASGLDFPDWVEVAAPRPYAIISTAQDMFPYAGALATATETRRFYALFDPASAGTPTNNPTPGIPTGPTLNPDTANTIPPKAALQWITGIGRHGNLGPISGQIVSFFLTHLANSNAAPILPPPPTPGSSPFALPASLPKDALQVTPTGQVSTSYPGSETVHTLTLKRYATLPKPKSITEPQLQQTIREVTHATIKPTDPAPINTQSPPLASPPEGDVHVRHRFTLATAPGINIQAEFYRPADGKHPVLLVLKDSSIPRSNPRAPKRSKNSAPSPTPAPQSSSSPPPQPTRHRRDQSLHPRPLLPHRTPCRTRRQNPPRPPRRRRHRAVSFTSGGTTSTPTRSAPRPPAISASSSSTPPSSTRASNTSAIDRTLESYKSLLEAPMPIDAPEDILPGVLLHYDIPDLIKALGPRVTFTNPTPRHRRPSNVNHRITLTFDRDLTPPSLLLSFLNKRASQQNPARVVTKTAQPRTHS